MIWDWGETLALSWLDRGRERKYCSERLGSTFVAMPSTRIWRSRIGQKKPRATRFWWVIWSPLADW